jgi:putative flavoprotein involved in K+ transport
MKPRLSPRRSRAFDGREAMADSHQTALQKDTAMKVEKTSIDTLVVGAGQAGVAMSEHLSTLGVPHLVLERDRIAERWHTGRWDSLVANGPAWHDRFPNLEFDDLDLDAFASKEQVADYFVAYAKKFDAPIRTGVEVTKVVRNAGRQGFTIETSDGTIEANRVVVATGPFQRPVIPSIAPKDGNFTQIHSADYRNPEQLPEGAVLVVGAGSSGVQIADELQRAGKQVYLSVGPHDRPPRAYRGRDFCWWLGVLGEWDAEVNRPGKEHVTIAVSGARGGQTVDFRRLAHQGITLVGLTKSFDDGVVTFESDLAVNIACGDENYLSLLNAADAYVARNGLDLPEDPEARVIPSDPECMTHPVLELDLAKAGVTSIIWATGYAVDFSWLKVNAFDEEGKPKHQRGVSKEPGVYFLGLPWLSRRGSAFIWGVWHDARHIADHIVTQRKYLAYRDASQRQAQGHSEDGADSASADSRVRKVSEIGVN